MKTLLAAVTVAVSVVACSSNTSGHGTATATANAGKSYADIRAVCTTLGYVFSEDTDQHELYTADQGECGPGQLVYWFGSDVLRDRWLAAALESGGAYVVGDRWVVSVEGLSDAQAVQAKVGGVVKQ